MSDRACRSSLSSLSFFRLSLCASLLRTWMSCWSYKNHMSSPQFQVTSVVARTTCVVNKGVVDVWTHLLYFLLIVVLFRFHLSYSALCFWHCFSQPNNFLKEIISLFGKVLLHFQQLVHTLVKRSKVLRTFHSCSLLQWNHCESVNSAKNNQCQLTCVPGPWSDQLLVQPACWGWRFPVSSFEWFLALWSPSRGQHQPFSKPFLFPEGNDKGSNSYLSPMFLPKSSADFAPPSKLVTT